MRKVPILPRPVRYSGAPARAIIPHGGSGSSSGGGGGGSGLSGSGTPEGSVDSDPGGTYWDTAEARLWVKDSGTGNTGWIAQIRYSSGNGTPEGSVTGRPGDRYTDLLTSQVFTKATGNNTNTGWI